jgi:hypothetical protein
MLLVLAFLIAGLPLGMAEDCAAGWVKFRSKCYYFSSRPEQLSYDQCNQNCPRYHSGATMLCIEDKYQNKFIQRHQVTSDRLHIGYRKGPGIEYVWFPGCYSLYRNWAFNEPNNQNGVEMYAQMYPDTGTWNDVPVDYYTCGCEYTLSFPANDDSDDTLYDDRPPQNGNHDDANNGGTDVNADGDDDNSSGGSVYSAFVVVLLLPIVCYLYYQVCTDKHQQGKCFSISPPRESFHYCMDSLKNALIKTPTGSRVYASDGANIEAPRLPGYGGAAVPAPYNPAPQAATNTAASMLARHPYSIPAPAPFAGATPTSSAPYAPTPYAPTPYAPTPYAPTPYTPTPHAPMTSITPVVALPYEGHGGQGVPVMAEAELVPIAHAGMADAQVVPASARSAGSKKKRRGR